MIRKETCVVSKSITIERINEIINEEREFAREINPQMTLGMAQIQMKLNQEANDNGK